MTCPTRRRALASHATREKAIEAAKRNDNVAFIRYGVPSNGVPSTCSRSFVCECINRGQRVEVLADFDNDD